MILGPLMKYKSKIAQVDYTKISNQERRQWVLVIFIQTIVGYTRVFLGYRRISSVRNSSPMVGESSVSCAQATSSVIDVRAVIIR